MKSPGLRYQDGDPFRRNSSERTITRPERRSTGPTASHTLAITPPRTLVAWLYHLLLGTLGGQCPSSKDHRIEFAMKHPLLSAGITFTRPYQGLWLISLYGKRVGTVEGNSVVGFTARDIDYHFIGKDNVSAKAAMHAWAP